MNTATKYTHRYLAQVDIEATTPLAISSGEKSLMTDAPVIKDVNGLPYIPGTSLTGVLRHTLEGADEDKLFGFQDGDGGLGSRIIISDGVLIGKDGRPIEGIYSYGKNRESDEFVKKFTYLPVRQHVRISASGSTQKGGKFDEQVVFKGARFRFEIELRSETEDKESFLKVLDVLSRTDFRLGGGTRSGFGEMKVVSCKWKALDLGVVADRQYYLQKSSSLDSAFDGEQYAGAAANGDTIKYELVLSPADFLLIGSGVGDDDADMTPVTESFIIWQNGKPAFATADVVIPASSLKGALAHRTAYHYNFIKKKYLDEIDRGKLDARVGESNDAVKCLFGSVSGKATRGKVLFSDIIKSSDKVSSFVLNHASIDRFTGGAKDSALYQEKVLYAPGETLKTSIVITDASNVDKEVIDAFEKALDDVCGGLLPLGGGTNRGNGCFIGRKDKQDK